MDVERDRTDGAPDRFDLVAIGETMVAFVSHDDPRRFVATMAGAESNVAVSMAQLGCRVRWVSRLGDDPLGGFLADEIAGRGVDVAVDRDGTRPTGVLVKHVVDARADVRYYRRGSAAGALSPRDLDRVGPADWIHVSGITPALSASAAELVWAVVDRSAGLGGRVSFDVNYRPVLWPDAPTAAGVLLELCRGADVVFIGDDEAEALFGTSRPGAVAELLIRRDDQQLVLKQGARGATVVTRDRQVTEPALTVEVIDAIGAGDAFAAGFLAATCSAWPLRDRLRLGHLMGARVVGVIDDTPPPFTADERAGLAPDRLAARWAG